MCNPQVDDVRLMRVLRLVRAGRDPGPRNRFWTAWAIAEELIDFFDGKLGLNRAGALELADLEAEYPQIPDLY
jgi:hypothetical protein